MLIALRNYPFRYCSCLFTARNIRQQTFNYRPFQQSSRWTKKRARAHHPLSRHWDFSWEQIRLDYSYRYGAQRNKRIHITIPRSQDCKWQLSRHYFLPLPKRGFRKTRPKTCNVTTLWRVRFVGVYSRKKKTKCLDFSRKNRPHK